MKTENELKISAEDFKLIKKFYPEFSRKQGIKSNDFIIGWSELMPVVVEIERVIKDYPNKDTSWLYFHNLFDGYINTNINITYDSVIGFIRWYNSQNS